MELSQNLYVRKQKSLLKNTVCWMSFFFLLVFFFFLNNKLYKSALQL